MAWLKEIAQLTRSNACQVMQVLLDTGIGTSADPTWITRNQRTVEQLAVLARP